MSASFREHYYFLQEYSLDEQLEDRAWDYLMWNVRAMGGPRLRKGTVTFIQHTKRDLGWPLRARPRWRGMRGSWRSRG